MKTSKRIAILCAASLTAILTAVTPLAAITTPSATAPVSASIMQTQARLTAQQYVPDDSTYISTVEKQTKYKVRFYSAGHAEYYNVSISKLTGKLAYFESKAIDSRGGTTTALGQPGAQNIVLKDFPNATITSTKLDSDDGLFEYKVDFTTSSCHGKYEINSQSGKVLEREIDFYTFLDSASGSETADGLLSYEKVQSIVAAQVPGGVLKELELKRKDGIYLYEAEVRMGGDDFDMLLNAKTGELLWSEYPSFSTPQKSSNAAGSITMERAVQIAMVKTPGTLKRSKLDMDEGAHGVYEITIVNGAWEYEYEIDASTGAVLDYDADYDD